MVNYYKVSVKSNTDNEFHEYINNSKAVIVELEVGKPMWFVYYLNDDYGYPWHRVKTSNVLTIWEIDGSITIATENSTYSFEQWEDDHCAKA